MRKAFLSSALLLCLVAAGVAGAQSKDQRELLRVVAPSELGATLIQRGMDVWSVSDRSLRVYVTPDEKAWLTRQGYEFQSEQPDLTRRLSDSRSVDGFLTFSEYESAMNGWVASHPGIVSLTSLGKSHENRDVWLLKISDNVGTQEAEPKALLISLQHAREWISGVTLHGIVNHFITGYGTNATVTDLVNSMEIYVVLVANPDGYVYTHTTDRMWRKNRRNNGNGTFGVDLNRNWPYVWVSGSPSSFDYGGPSALSEPETQALLALLNSRKIDGMLNYHSYGTRIMHNWAYSYTLPPNANVMGDLAFDMAQQVESVNGQTMRNGSWAITLEYTGNGATDDYTHAVLGIPTLTFELRPVSEDPAGFAPPGTTIAPSVSENIPGAIYFLQWVRERAANSAPPVLSNVAVNRISNNEATVTWNTDNMCTRTVQFATTPALGSQSSPDALRGLDHTVRLTGLASNTIYYYRVGSQSMGGGLTWSGQSTFQTTAVAMDITPPQYPGVRVLRRSSPGMMEIGWEKLDSSPLAGYRLYESSNEGTSWTLLRDETTLLPASTSAIIPAPPINTQRWYRMTAVDSATYRNESIPSDAYALRVGPGASRVLVVDGFDRWNNMTIAQNQNHAFAAVHGSAISNAGAAFDTCANQAVGVEVSLTSYDSVFWVLGTESTGNETFSTAEQSLVQTFLSGGGDLFVSGSEIGYDLDAAGTTVDRAFFNNYLSADYVKDSIGEFTLNGSGGASIFGTQRIDFDDGSRRIYRVDSADQISGLNGATNAIRTPGLEGTAITRHGVFGAGIIPGHIVMLSFPLETVYPASVRDWIIAVALQFFSDATAASDWQLY